jgi:hypothetical protein
MVCGLCAFLSLQGGRIEQYPGRADGGLLYHPYWAATKLERRADANVSIAENALLGHAINPARNP